MTLVFAAALSAGIARADDWSYHYNPETGHCENKLGEIGNNPFTSALFSHGEEKEIAVSIITGDDEGLVGTAMVHEEIDAECVDLRGVDFSTHIGLEYPVLLRWNLAGAVLDRALFHFAYLIDADLRGADLTEFQFGYAQITGVVDTHTMLPTIGVTLQRIELLDDEPIRRLDNETTCLVVTNREPNQINCIQ